MTDSQTGLSALIVDDQDDCLSKLRPAFGDADPAHGDRLPPQHGRRLKYFSRPDFAIQFLKKIERGELDWRPHYAFVDFQFTRYRETGLSVLRAVRRACPETIPVLYVDLDATRTLFAAAAREWFEVVHVIDKTEANQNTFDMLLADRDPTPPGVERRLRTHAHLINGLFRDHHWAAIWAIWKDTQGNKAQLMRITGLKRAQIDSFLGRGNVAGAPEAVFRYQDAMEVHVIGERAPQSYRDERKRQLPLTDFASQHSRFFEDPMLEVIVKEVQPWKRLTTR